MAVPDRRRSPRRARQEAERAGRRAETLAAAYLMLHGFQILARRFKASGGEIDLAAKRGDLVVFAEVKARRTFETAVEAVTPRTRRRIEQAGRRFISDHPALADCAVRYDIIAVSGWRVRRLKDAWREGDIG